MPCYDGMVPNEQNPAAVECSKEIIKLQDRVKWLEAALHGTREALIKNNNTNKPAFNQIDFKVMGISFLEYSEDYRAQQRRDINKNLD